jgi:hypothetical protein
MSVRPISIWDLTESDLDLAEASRRATHPVADTPSRRTLLQLISILDSPQAKKVRPAKHRPMRACSRCGIDTTEPTLCIDCTDVLALERAS